MGWPPAVVIVVRHGARLDAADKQWHLTSPTPYDPPLTYGGWSQSRALGQRIANILRTRETDDEVISPLDDDGKSGGDRRKRRHKVIIHSSPFLRCVQTSIGISAGLAQNPGHSHQRPHSAHSTTGKAMHSSPKMRPTINTGSPSLAPIPEPALAGSKPPDIKKSTIRIDAFLGEWLTPDYFELITPPPSSLMMVAGAKADLLRREDYSGLTNQKEAIVGGHQKPFPGGWGSPVVAAEQDKDEGPLSSMSALGQALHRRDRTGSLSSVGTNGSHNSHHSARAGTSLQSAAEHGVYQPPVPNYAISLSDPIPQGYVAHSRDACVDVDYQWDSMREPHLWGNGGEYGEEWSSMHKRFRKGLQQMVGWYQNDNDPGKLSKKSPSSPAALSPGQEDHVEEEDTDLVLILVTHGAGCNALIGALTNQPVLLDVGMTSLTMAVRKPDAQNTPPATPGATPKSQSPRTSRLVNISDEYDVKLIANTEHLRNTSTSSTPTASRSSSIVSGSFRERFGSTTAHHDSNKARPITAAASLGSIRRTASIASSQPRSYVPTRQSSVGLWSATPTEEKETPEELEDDMIINFGNDGTAIQDSQENHPSPPPPEKVTQEVAEGHEVDEVAPLGLWGSPRPPGVAERNRDTGPKRRWTVNERTQT
ncbi:Phosphoglycerate mutase-like protein [Glarea lozoyensis ATCC 20868]|uniref:Phosphoglycerate mutase-like protein n=1 Tax=Glarea lozoyensis (strain ATCC 20868 / MF5171) TaxID=1116229 RepID=S3CYW4_GLAL2|nr:Phosphoglycerate mutase-like protein [Glarea lozoyensis ATCC 20868]EPE31467.1 Phosphoglycerate mutase-like protein [Glarea lozoyensis ATCC 20868]